MTSRRQHTLLLVLLCTVVIAVFTWVKPGPLSIDEVTYHRMTHDLADGHGFFVSNGYEELGSPELTSKFIRATDDGRLAAQYPYGSALVAVPFYSALGLRGMFLLNALAFVLAVWLCHRITVQLLRSRALATAAAALLVATYFSEYALASWPHATAVTAVLAAFSFAVAAYQTHARPQRALMLALTSGVFAGLAATFRLDALFCLPALAGPFLLASPTRLREVAAIALGCVPGAAFIVITNYVRWGGLTPLSYGPKAPPMDDYWAFAVGGAVAIVLAWIITRPRCIAGLKQHKQSVALITLLVALVVFVVMPWLASGVATANQGLVGIIADLRALPAPGVEFLDSRAVTIGDDYKKALLQSCPVLIVVVLPIVRALQGHRDRFAIGWLLIVPATVIGFFGAFAWHGGIAVNLRYLLPALPFLCVLVASVGRELAAMAHHRWPLWTVLAFALTIVGYASAAHRSFVSREQLLLTGPLVLSALLAIAVVVWAVRKRRSTATVALITMAAAVGWTTAATGHDIHWSRERRAQFAHLSASVGPRLPNGALLLAEFPDPFYGVVEYSRDVAIAVPYVDDYQDTGRLIDEALHRGRRVFGALKPGTWQELERRGALRNTATHHIEDVDSYVFGELRLSP